MAKEDSKFIDYTALFLLGVLVVGSLTWLNNDPQVVTQSVDLKPIYDKLDKIETDVGSIQIPEEITVIDLDKVWKEEAINLATAEWSEKSYKAIYNTLTDIDEREDISNVIIKDNEVTDIDTEDKDATVVQEVKVYYETLDGDDVKVYLIITTEIDDNEIEFQEIEFK